MKFEKFFVPDEDKNSDIPKENAEAEVLDDQALIERVLQQMPADGEDRAEQRPSVKVDVNLHPLKDPIIPHQAARTWDGPDKWDGPAKPQKTL